MPDADLTFNFSLQMLGNINPNLMSFFEALNPGFKIYVGDFLVFDFSQENQGGDKVRETFTIDQNNNAISVRSMKK